MLPLEWLAHHPDNPRKELGNLTELAASIRESGIMQNLTVVPRHDGEQGYFVVIGNRRMEAAKIAGLKQAPVVISDMDYKTQLATMMAENMQRADLTLLEQAQGVQQMLDLGMEIGEIARKTGLRKDSVKRRRLLSKYDPQLAAAAIAKGGTLLDFCELEKVEDESARIRLMAKMGTPEFRRDLTWALERQKEKRLADALVAKLDTFATNIERKDYVGEKRVPMTESRRWFNLTDKGVQAVEVPTDIRDVRYYWLRYGQGSVTLYREAQEYTPEDPAELREEEQRRWKLKKREQAMQVDKVLQQMRMDFLLNSPSIRYDEKAIMEGLTASLAFGLCGVTGDEATMEGFTRMTGIRVENKGYAAYPNEADMAREYQRKPLLVALATLWMRLDRDVYHAWNDVYDDHTGLKFRGSKQLELLYRVLTACGYEMCLEEKAYMDGTHEIYQRWQDGMD